MSQYYKRKRCIYCHQIFTPDPRIKDKQKTCNRQLCQTARKKQTQKRWTKRNPDYFKGRYGNTRDWLKKHPGYLKEYRKSHPEYVKKNSRRQKKLRTGKSPLTSKQNQIVDIQDAINSQLIALARVRDHFVSVDIQDDIYNIALSKYTSNRIICKQLLWKLKKERKLLWLMKKQF